MLMVSVAFLFTNESNCLKILFNIRRFKPSISRVAGTPAVIGKLLACSDYWPNTTKYFAFKAICKK